MSETLIRGDDEVIRATIDLPDDFKPDLTDANEITIRLTTLPKLNRGEVVFEATVSDGGVVTVDGETVDATIDSNSTEEFPRRDLWGEASVLFGDERSSTRLLPEFTVE